MNPLKRALAVPGNDSSGWTMTSQDRQSLHISQSPKESIGGPQFGPPHRATQDTDLMPKGAVLQL